MFLVDNLLLSPFTSLLWVFKEINEAVQQEKAGEHEGITRSLSELYMKLETGAITEEQFESEEKQLLDRLDAIELRNDGGGDESDDEVDEEADDKSDEGETDVNAGTNASRGESRTPHASKGAGRFGAGGAGGGDDSHGDGV